MSFTREVKRYILRAGGITKKELIEKFGKAKAIEAMLSYGRKTGQIIEKDGLIYYSPRQFNADRVFKAVRILKSFTARQIALYTGLKIKQVSSTLTDFERLGYIERAGKDEKDKRAVLWVLVKDDPDRPPLKGGCRHVTRKRHSKTSNDCKDSHSQERARA